MNRNAWNRIRAAFATNRAAQAALAVLIVLYASVAIAPWLAPYHFDDEFRPLTWAEPTSIHFRATDGSWHRPFVHPISSSFDENAQRIWVEDTTIRVPIELFVNGRLFGLRPPTNASSARLYLLGADSRGRDMFSRILYGARISLTIGIVGVLITTFAALLVGGIAGFAGGTVDSVLMRFCEIVMLIPGFYLLMLLRASLPLEWDSRVVYLSIVLILSFIGWAGLARLVRGMVLSIRKVDHVAAAKALGATNWRILWTHVLPQTYGLIAVQATLAIPGYIIAESGLSLLGLGIQDPQTSWGNLLQEAMSVSEIRLHPWSLLPGAFLFAAVLGYNLVGDALRDALDPRGNE